MPVESAHDEFIEKYCDAGNLGLAATQQWIKDFQAVIAEANARQRRKSLELAIGLLNEAFELDRDAIQSLYASRVPCNGQLADHPTVQVGLERGAMTPFTVGPLGLINGIMERLTGQKIAVELDEKYKTILKFVPYVDPRDKEHVQE